MELATAGDLTSNDGFAHRREAGDRYRVGFVEVFDGTSSAGDRFGEAQRGKEDEREGCRQDDLHLRLSVGRVLEQVP